MVTSHLTFIEKETMLLVGYKWSGKVEDLNSEKDKVMERLKKQNVPNRVNKEKLIEVCFEPIRNSITYYAMFVVSSFSEVPSDMEVLRIPALHYLEWHATKLENKEVILKQMKDYISKHPSQYTHSNIPLSLHIHHLQNAEKTYKIMIPVVRNEASTCPEK